VKVVFPDDCPRGYGMNINPCPNFSGMTVNQKQEVYKPALASLLKKK
jgi:hypothetical protein